MTSGGLLWPALVGSEGVIFSDDRRILDGNPKRHGLLKKSLDA
jgi:hypothetical protein